MERDTIAAISTGQLPSGIAVIRLSGSQSVPVVQSVFSGKKPLKDIESHSMTFGAIFNGDEKLDEVLVAIMKAPNSYTGEDVVEISCHGSLLIQKNILSLLLENGARLANPGEYTLRAFLNGKLDLDQAESVMDVISSENDYMLKKSMDHLSGDFSALITNVREKILYEIAYIESALDDPEHISLDGYSDRLLSVIDEQKEVIDRLINSYSSTSLIRNGIDCAIIGRTNVGKSSILNALSRSEKAIVTDIPGTTRDAIEQRIRLGNLTLNVIDTAGIRNTDDKIENMGISISKDYMKKADLVLYVLDGSLPSYEEDIELLNDVLSKESIILINKTDLPLKLDINEIKCKFNKTVIKLSAKSYIGFDVLEHKIEEIFINKERSIGNDPVVTNERQLFHLKNALESLNKVIDAVHSGMTEEIFTVDMTDAYESLGKILGLNVSDDIINEIFSKFCIGK